MLTVLANGPRSRRFCDGVSRRNFIKIGALGMGGLALPQLLQAEAAAGIRKSHKAVIMIYLPGWPPFGAVASKVLGAVDPGVPPFIGLEPRMQHRPYNAATPGFLGVGHNSFRPAGEGKADMVLNGVTLDRLADRKTLLKCFDKFRRDVDTTGLMEGMDTFNQQAFGVLTSSKLLEALDFQREDQRVIEAYGKGDPKPHGDAAPMLMEQFLVARRLVEAGARVVTVAFGFWDYHGNNHKNAKADLPLLDQGVSALVDDLHRRGMEKDVSVVVWGEFGRTPTINKDAGRDHWPKVSCAMLFGGGMKAGQGIGATGRFGGEAVERPVCFGEGFAAVYTNLCVDWRK